MKKDLERGEGSWWVRKCWEEIKKRGGKKGSEWEEQRKKFYKERSVGRVGAKGMN